MKPEISIIVPIYNVEQYLDDCLKSILNQTFTNFEVILVNDGSTDQSGNICEFYKEKDRRVKVIHKSYGGVSSARNIGIERALGKYIGFVDGDDRIKENMYQVLHDLCTTTYSDIAISRLGREINSELIIKDDKTFVKELTNNQAMKELFKGMLYRFSLCNKLFVKKCFDGITFPNGRIHEDLATTYKLFANANKCVYTNEIGYIYVKRENSILTSDYNEKRLDSFRGWDEILLFMKKYYPQLYPEVVSCFTYWSVDHIFYVIFQVKRDSKKQLYYLKEIQYYIRKHYKDIKLNELALNIKYIIFGIHKNIKVLKTLILLKSNLNWRNFIVRKSNT